MRHIYEALVRLVRSSQHQPALVDLDSDEYALRTYGSVNAEWLWILRASGTTLVRLGVHARVSGWGAAALEADDLLAIYHCDITAQLRRVDQARAFQLLQWMRYRVGADHVYRDGRLIATLKFGEHACWPGHTSISCAIDAPEEPDRETAAALYLIAVAEAGERYTSYRIESLTLNGAPLLALLMGASDQAVDPEGVAITGMVAKGFRPPVVASRQDARA